MQSSRSAAPMLLLAALTIATSLSAMGCAKPVPSRSEMEPCPQMSIATWKEVVEILSERSDDGGYRYEAIPLWISDIMRFCEWELDVEPSPDDAR